MMHSIEHSDNILDSRSKNLKLPKTFKSSMKDWRFWKVTVVEMRGSQEFYFRHIKLNYLLDIPLRMSNKQMDFLVGSSHTLKYGESSSRSCETRGYPKVSGESMTLGHANI